MLIAKAACLGQNGHRYDFNSLYLQTFYISLSVAATSTSNRIKFYCE